MGNNWGIEITLHLDRVEELVRVLPAEVRDCYALALDCENFTGALSASSFSKRATCLGPFPPLEMLVPTNSVASCRRSNRLGGYIARDSSSSDLPGLLGGFRPQNGSRVRSWQGFSCSARSCSISIRGRCSGNGLRPCG